MLKRKIITIDEDSCNGCGLCVTACHEGALQMVNGKAKLVSDSYCDGLGDCLPACPTGAIKIVEREAAPFDEEAVAARMASAKSFDEETSAALLADPESCDEEAVADLVADAAAAPSAPLPPLPCGCPGTMTKSITRPAAPRGAPDSGTGGGAEPLPALGNWPVQIKLIAVNAPYLANASLLIAADCTAFASPVLHQRFMEGRVVMIGCPKLDEGDYAEKLTAILQTNEIRSVTVLRMEVPCCAGIVNAVRKALVASGKMIPWRVVTVTTDGRIIEE